MNISNPSLQQLGIVLFLALNVVKADTTLAQSYPNKSIRFIVGAPPGGGSDFVARIVGLKLGAAFGQAVIIDFRGGAGGNIAAELAAKAVPDGYTLFLATPSSAINPILYRKLTYNLVKDFAPITQVTAQAYIFFLHPSVPAKTVKEFIAFAKSKKGGIIYGSSGVGQAQHLGMELLKTLAGFEAVHVPYSGSGPAIIALIGGQINASMVSMPGGLPHVKSGQLRAIAVTSLKRSVFLPEIPTVAEAEFPGYEVSGWYGLLAPTGTPRVIITRLHQEVSAILKLPEVRDQMVAGGSDPVGNTPEEFAAYIKSETIKWGKVIKQSGATAD